jgi:hypothetical protein
MEQQLFENSFNKTALVKFSGGNREPAEVIIGPGTMTLDLLNHLGMDNKDYSVSHNSSNKYLGPNDMLFEEIQNGDLLFVTSKADAGN